MSEAPPPDLSKATQLEDLSFRCEGLNVRWITMALQTVLSETLQRITVHPGATYRMYPIGEAVRQEWRDLDRLLVQFWTSRPICPKIVYAVRKGNLLGGLGRLAPSLLPELTQREAVDLVEE